MAFFLAQNFAQTKPHCTAFPLKGACVAMLLSVLMMSGGGLNAQGMNGMGGGFGQPQTGPGGRAPAKKKRRSRRFGVGSATRHMTESQEKAREYSKTPGVYRSTSPKAGTVSEVLVLGAKRAEPDAILSQIASEVDREPSPMTVRGDVRRIYGLALFDQVVVRMEDLSDGSFRLQYIVTERPAVAEVRFEGLKKYTREELDDVVEVQKFDVVDVPLLQSYTEKLQAKYAEDGLFLTTVRVRTEKSEGVEAGDEPETLAEWVQNKNENKKASDASQREGENAKTSDTSEARFVDVIFEIDERDKVRIERIDFVGNEKFSDDELRSATRSREIHPFGLMTEWGTFKESNIPIDPAALEFFYQDRGYVRVKVSPPTVELSNDRKFANLTLRVDEGEQYFVQAIDIDGDFVVESPPEHDPATMGDDANAPSKVFFVKNELESLLQIGAGDVFSKTKLIKSVESILNAYKNRGYAFADIEQIPELNDETKEVRLGLRLRAGPRVKIGRIDIAGNTRTQDEVIRREFRVLEGDWYHHNQLQRSEGRIKALGYFENVIVTPKVGDDGQTMDLKVQVSEKPTGTFNVGAGWGSFEGLMGQGQIAQNNLGGKGVTLNANFQISRIRRMFSLNYMDPYWKLLNDEPVTLQFSLYNNAQNFIDFQRNSTGLDLTFGYPLGRPLRKLFSVDEKDWRLTYNPYRLDLDNLRGFLSWRTERVEIGDQLFDVRHTGLTPYVPRYTSSLGFSFVLDQRNDRLRTSKGYFFQFGYEYANPYFGSGLYKPIEEQFRDWAGNGRLFKRGGRANDFHRLRWVSRGYLSLDTVLPFKGAVLKGNLELGYLVTDDPSLIFERYYLGGLNTVRGYFPRSISPVERVPSLDPDRGLQEFRVGGNKQLIANLELEFPIFDPVGFRGVFFLDAGNSYAKGENLFYIGNKPNPYFASTQCGTERCFDPRADLDLGVYLSWGFGVRWFSPIGPLRFEWGFPFPGTRRPPGTLGFNGGDNPFQFEFNIGTSF